MDIKDFTITKQGKPIEGKPQPGIYYTADIQGGSVKEARKALAKAHPRCFFNIRPSRAQVPAPVPPVSKPEAK